MSTDFCPHCHRPMPRTARLGVALTPLKARIFDLIKRSDGMTRTEINSVIYGGKASPETIKAHIWQINEALTDTGWRITTFRLLSYLRGQQRGQPPAIYAVTRPSAGKRKP